MVAAQDQNLLCPVGSDDVEILVDRIGGAFVPTIASAFGRWQDFDGFSKLAIA